MMRSHGTYPIEQAAERLINEIRKSLKKVVGFFFVIPKGKMDKYVYVIETLAWLFLTLALILRR
jgi:hypothetical protein